MSQRDPSLQLIYANKKRKKLRTERQKTCYHLFVESKNNDFREVEIKIVVIRD
jgi:hypothetical protein